MRIKNLYKSYDGKVIYDGFNLDIEDGKTTVILGESGNGKTTLLKCIANLTDYDGEITGNTPVSFVFQKDRLVPNLTVFNNLQLVCSDNEKILNGLKDIGLIESANEYPKNLSGGMSRRVAILRAVLYDAPILLLDEPFINLDIKMKTFILKRLKTYQTENNKTVVMVTHDIYEAVNIADRIIVLKDGKVVYDCNSIENDTMQRLYEVMSK